MHNHSTPADLFGNTPTKYCKCCKRHLLFENFYLSKNGKRHSICKPCSSKKNKEWYKTPDGQTHNRRNLLRRRGLTIGQYNDMLAAQGGVCAICQEVETKRDPRGDGSAQLLGVDHDHKTGAVRALLCDACNKGVGFFRDDPALMRAAAIYVESFKKPA